MFRRSKLEKLEDLPVPDEANPSPQEEKVMTKFFSEPDGTTTKSNKSNSQGWGHTIKLAGLAALLFMALANPFVDSVFNFLPYCGGNAFAIFGIKIFLFMILFVLVAKYLM